MSRPKLKSTGNSLSPRARAESGALLTGVLADLTDQDSPGKQAHGKFRGNRGCSLHRLFDEVAELGEASQ